MHFINCVHVIWWTREEDSSLRHLLIRKRSVTSVGNSEREEDEAYVTLNARARGTI